MRKTTSLLSALTLVLAGVSVAKGSPAFEEVDANDDGLLSSEEIRGAGLTLSVDDADQDGDGALSRAEFLAAVEAEKESTTW